MSVYLALCNIQYNYKYLKLFYHKTSKKKSIEPFPKMSQNKQACYFIGDILTNLNTHLL